MHSKFATRVMLKTLLLLCIIPATVFSQITITSPITNSVYQRDVTGQREVTIAGTFAVPVDKIEARAIPVIEGQGIATAWKELQVAPKGGAYQGNLLIYAGWYTVEVRGTVAGQVVGRAVLQRLGVGEVFIIAGQSNAQGLKKFGGPSAVDDRVQYISNYINDVVDKLDDPPVPVFSKITSNTNFISPRGQTAWCWGILGDMLVTKLNMPVLFINTAWEGTSAKDWALSSQGKPTTTPFGYTMPLHMPYANLRISAQNYASQYGLRAILWMQGESDGLKNDKDNNLVAGYRDNLQTLMNSLGIHTGKRITWVIARTSRIAEFETVPNKIYPAIIAAQNAVIDQSFNPTWPGPETDPLDPERLGDGNGDRTHFSGVKSLTLLANAWNESLNASFFSRVPPVVSEPVPALSAICTTGNNGVTISLPTTYKSYRWQNETTGAVIPGATGSSITVSQAGKYSAVVKDDFGNTIIASAVILEKDAKPAKPTIMQQGPQQACADSAFQFSVAPENNTYSWFVAGSTNVLGTGSSIKIGEAGNYQVRAQNIFGCVSDNSDASSLIIRPAISKPVIEAGGPFSVTASIAEQGLNEKYLWRRPGSDQDTTANVIKILKTGIYSTRAQVVFTLGNNSLTCYSDSASREFKTNESNEIVIYPNPSQGARIYVESRDDIRDASVTLYDIFGRVIRITPPVLLNSRLELDVSTLAAGKYILRVTGQNTSLTKQIVIR
ncbi:T9SS type A sorting domain-containing protein [Dyadobacter sp. CY312]|uniref:T9SS type A sorting domain-containing protein n=1 Tax=Dyadobacter sp. CY312 TaxID=2907303 RepID=UPI001F2E2EEF|nr:T9SS type A sorting domain-containing protein [Dyadobacter sp. CY312]MCE7042288.1 T9SS type A sorting domain-containing protein [Dyadobacter sp. CY312]